MSKRQIIILMLVLVFSLNMNSFAFQNLSREYVIYNSFAYIVETRTINFETGDRSYEITDLPASILPQSIFIDVPAENVNIIRQQYESETLNYNRILSNYQGKRITISLIEWEIIEGTYLGLSGNDILINDGSVRSINRNQIKNMTFHELNTISPFKPFLSIDASSTINSNIDVKIHYLAERIGWSGEYVGYFDPDRDVLKLRSWARITNRSGSSLISESTVLISGEPNRVQVSGSLPQPRLSMRAQAMDVEQAGVFTEEQAHIYHKFSLDSQLDVNNESEQRLKLFTDKNISVEQEYIFDFNRYGRNAVNFIKFDNDDNSGIGEPIPSGVIRLYEEGDRPSSLFLGEDNIKNTPVDGKISIRLGKVFDITGKRTQTNYRRISDRSREETYSIEITNSNTDEKEVIVNEHFSGEWRITESSLEYSKIDSNTLRFNMNIPGRNSEVITFTVRFN
ncbi:DUF4139 domain-containing protein [candidate division KSB1 bacterium]